MSDRVTNLHTVWMSGHPLGVECECGRRALLSHDKIDAHSGNMKELRQLKFKCLACGSRKVTFRIFQTEAAAQAFEAEADRPGPRF